MVRASDRDADRMLDRPALFLSVSTLLRRDDAVRWRIRRSALLVFSGIMCNLAPQ